jgi:hypothetical protein
MVSLKTLAVAIPLSFLALVLSTPEHFLLTGF